MALTGVDFTKEFERRVDKSYNDYYAPSVFKQFIKRGLQAAITAKYNQLDNQRRFDELRGLLVYKKSVPATSGRIALQNTPITNFDSATGIITTSYPHNALLGSTISVNIVGDVATYSANVVVSNVTENTITIPAFNIGVFENGSFTTTDTITDYMHLFAVRAKYYINSIDEISGIEIVGSKVNIILTKRSKLRNGDKIIVSGVVGCTNANGVKYVNQVGTKKYQLYNDAKLESPTIANGKYVSGGDIVNEYENACFPIKPDMDTIQKVDTPTPLFPRFQISENALIIEPSDGLQSVNMDYIKTPPFDIDPLDNNTDLLLYYSREMIDFTIDFMARLFDLNTKDVQSLNIDNPQVAITQ